MSLIYIKAEIECDNCGKHFTVNVEPTMNFKQGEQAFDLAVEAVMNSTGYDMKNNPESYLGISSYQNDKMLCHECTRNFDNIEEEDSEIY